jgi:hypothetical protein
MSVEGSGLNLAESMISVFAELPVQTEKTHEKLDEDSRSVIQDLNPVSSNTKKANV